MADLQNIPLKSGIVYIKTHGGTTFAEGDGTNNQTTFDALNAVTGFNDIGEFQSFSATRAREDERTINSDRCSSGEILSNSTPIWSAGFDYISSTNLAILADLVGLTVQNVAGTPVTGATNTVSNPTSGKFVTLGAPTGASSIAITSVTGDTDGLLVAGTDYDLVQDGTGNWGLIFKSGGNITTFTQSFDIVFDYTPLQVQVMVEKSASKKDAYVDLKFVSCPNANGESDTAYLVKAKLTSELVINWIDLANNDFAPSPTTISTVKGGNFIYGKTTLSPL